MAGFEKYRNMLTCQINQFLDEEGLINNPEYQKAFKNHCFGLNGQKYFPTKQTSSEKFLSKMVYGFREISDSYYFLKDIETYIGRFPYRNTKISQTRYLAYHFENYLNEIYLLKERLACYFTVIGRLYKKDSRHGLILKKTSSLSNFVDDSLKGIIKTRGTHVHQTRFTDEDLDRLKTQEFLTEHSGKKLKSLGNLFKEHYGITRRKYKQIIKANNGQVKKMLDLCFDTLFEIIANNEGQIKHPKMDT